MKKKLLSLVLALAICLGLAAVPALAADHDFIINDCALTDPTIHYGSGVPSVPTTGGFTDVKATDYFADAVQWAVSMEITTGTSATTFSPDETCTVAQILTFLYRANGSPQVSISNPFTNVSASDYYYSAVLWAYQRGLISGYSFNSSAPCTRSMVVTYLWKLAGSPAADLPTPPTASSLAYAPHTISGVDTYTYYPGVGSEFAIQFDAAVTLKTKITLHQDEWDPESTIRDLTDPITYDITLVAVRPDSKYTIDGGFYGFSYEATNDGGDGTIWINGIPGSPYFRASDGSFRYVTTPMGHDDTEFALYEDSLSNIRLYSSEFSDMGSGGSADCGVLIQLDGTYYFVTYADSAIAAGLLDTDNGSGFSDVPSNASYAQAVAWAVEKSITTGDGANTFSPDKTCTRGQIVTFLYRGLAK